MTHALFYSGPPMEQLHEQYAKQRRIDQRAPVQAADEVEIDAPIERVWDRLSSPTSWSNIAERIHSVRLESDVRADAYFTWANGRTRMRSRFAVVDKNRELTWSGSAAGIRAVHRHVLKPLGVSRTQLSSVESMSAPLLVALFPSRKLQATLTSWLRAVKAAAERP